MRPNHITNNLSLVITNLEGTMEEQELCEMYICTLLSMAETSMTIDEVVASDLARIFCNNYKLYLDVVRELARAGKAWGNERELILMSLVEKLEDIDLYEL